MSVFSSKLENSGKAWCHRNMSQNFLDTCHHLSIVQGVQGTPKQVGNSLRWTGFRVLSGVGAHHFWDPSRRVETQGGGCPSNVTCQRNPGPWQHSSLWWTQGSGSVQNESKWAKLLRSCSEHWSSKGLAISFAPAEQRKVPNCVHKIQRQSWSHIGGSWISKVYELDIPT